MPEIWKPVVGYEGVYEISNAGLVKRVLQCKGTRSNRILKARAHSRTGYYYVNLWRNNRGETCNVHALVANAFLGTRPDPQHVVNHINHIRTDNRVENLEWITHGENIRLGYQHIGYKPGKVYRGSENVLSKLTESEVVEIRKLHKTGNYSQAHLCTMFGISPTHMSRIINRSVWKHV